MAGRPSLGHEFARARVGLAAVVSKHRETAEKRELAPAPSARATPRSTRETRALAHFDARGRATSGDADRGVKATFRYRDQLLNCGGELSDLAVEDVALSC